MSKSLYLEVEAVRGHRPRAPIAARRAAAHVLGAASKLLGRLSAELSAAPRIEHAMPPVLEFYADAGAPEGALYLNGELVGYLPGVARL